MEKCCLIVSANVSYQNAAIDVKVLTGIEVSAKTQQRLVHRQKFQLPQSQQEIQELSVDGGKIRLRTPLGEPCIWRDYKGIRIHEQVVESAVKQIDRRTKISGAQWLKENVAQVLAHRCAYLNGLI